MNTENSLTLRGGHDPSGEVDEFVTPEVLRPAPHAGMNLYDILFILFRHKWKIMLCATLGVLGALAVYFILPPLYESEAKLFVRYVVDKGAIDGIEPQVKTPGLQSENVMNSEVEILTSVDLARQVADAIGAKRLAAQADPKTQEEAAVRTIMKGLEVSAVKGTNVLSVSYKSGDKELPVPVLQELVKRYFDKHLEVHRSAGAFDYVARETEQMRAQLAQTEDDLKALKARAGVISVEESVTNLNAQLGKAEGELDTAEAELSSQQARVSEIEKSLAITDAGQQENTTRRATSEAIQQYQSLATRLTQLRQSETDLLAKYTSQNRIVKVKQAQIADLEKQRRDLEKRYPDLAGTAAAAGPARPDLLTERARLVASRSKVETLRERVRALQEQAKELAVFVPQIGQLQRKKDVEEARYKQYAASLEKARIDETLDPSRIPNISIVQAPSPAIKATRDIKKIVIGLLGGGFAVGIAIALLIELVLDRTIKRSLELEKRLQIPLLMTIPNFGANGQGRLRLHDVGPDSQNDELKDLQDGSVEDESGVALRPFCEAIRDRLGLFFEMNRMAHKPKLVAVTGLSKGAGASTLAAGLADTLSESVESKVLLVDKPCTPKRFYDMMAKFKASDLDYVVFDMPSLGDTSATLPMAGFMDTVLLVVEAEKSNREAVKRAYSQLSAKTKVSVVFNKSRSYGPKWLQGEV